MNQIHINDKVGQQKKILGHLYIMNRNFKLKVNSPTLSTITSHLNSVITKKTIMYNIGNTGTKMGQWDPNPPLLITRSPPIPIHI